VDLVKGIGIEYDERWMTPTVNAPEFVEETDCTFEFSDVKNMNMQMTFMSGGIDLVERLLSSCNKKCSARSAELMS